MYLIKPILTGKTSTKLLVYLYYKLTQVSRKCAYVDNQLILKNSIKQASNVEKMDRF